MQRAMEQFRSNIKAIKEMEALYEYLTSDLKLPNDLSDILRSQLVYAVSALDKLVHELVRIGMLQAFAGKRPKTTAFNSFSISSKTLIEIQKVIQSTNPLQLETPEYFFEQEITIQHKRVSFQDPDSINKGLSFIWEEKFKWQKIALSFNISDDDLKKKLKAIMSRRNQIVHEADIDSQTNSRNPIDKDDVKEAVEFIVKLGEKIFEAVTCTS